jgi:hypothetical protein
MTWADAIWRHLIEITGVGCKDPNCKFCKMIKEHTEEELDNMEYV